LCLNDAKEARLSDAPLKSLESRRSARAAALADSLDEAKAAFWAAWSGRDKPYLHEKTLNSLNRHAVTYRCGAL
jgi:hypothetical protein